MYKRTIEKAVFDQITAGDKVIILYGPRQVGKTTLINAILEKFPEKKQLSLLGDDLSVQKTLSQQDSKIYQQLFSGYDLLFIDEAQRVPNIGINLKIIHDSLPKLRIIVTGSSSFDLANKVKEPLTGRTRTFHLFPLSYEEISREIGRYTAKEATPDFLVYGSYPNIYTQQSLEKKRIYLHELSSSYIYKDILNYDGIRQAQKINDLLRLLAFQIGSQVSLLELSNTLNMSKDTVGKYITILEKAFIVFRLKGFSRNLRNETTKQDKIYFYDLGIRNSIIDNLKPLSLRDDHGKLWENFIIAERRKHCLYHGLGYSSYFWRLYSGSEIDYVEEVNNQLTGYEIKYNPKIAKTPKTWASTYPQAKFTTINTETFTKFITDQM